MCVASIFLNLLAHGLAASDDRDAIRDDVVDVIAVVPFDRNCISDLRSIGALNCSLPESVDRDNARADVDDVEVVIDSYNLTAMLHGTLLWCWGKNSM